MGTFSAFLLRNTRSLARDMGVNLGQVAGEKANVGESGASYWEKCRLRADATGGLGIGPNISDLGCQAKTNAWRGVLHPLRLSQFAGDDFGSGGPRNDFIGYGGSQVKYHEVVIHLLTLKKRE